MSRVRWRLNRLFDRGTRAQDLFDEQCGSQLMTSGRPFVFMPWVPSHGDALVAALATSAAAVEPKELRALGRLPEPAIVPLRLFRAPDQLAQRRKINAFVVDHPVAYRDLLRAVLSPLRERIAGLVVTLDWPPPMRQAAYACRELGIPSVLIPHEAVFADRERYYVDRLTGGDAPICDVTLCWGELQRQIFLERGTDPERVKVVGSPKLDRALAYRPTLSRQNFCDLHGFSRDRSIVLFAMQPLDSQFAAERARAAQNSAIHDLAELTRALGAQLLVRVPPSGHALLSPGLRRDLMLTGARVDDHPHKTDAHEALAHCACVCSINSTMLLEGLVMGRAAISTRYLEFGDLWGSAGIPAAHDRGELEGALKIALAGAHSASTSGLAWAARAFSVGSFDGLSAARIRVELSAMRRAPTLAPSLPPALFSGAKATRRQGTAAFEERARPATEGLAELLGFRRALFAPAWPEAQTADVLIRAFQGGRPSGRLRALHRPELFVERGPLSARLRDMEAPRSVTYDTLAPHFAASRPTRLTQRLNSGTELTAVQHERIARALGLLRALLTVRDPAPQRREVLLVDELRCDARVALGGAADASFRAMLEDALLLDGQPQITVLRPGHPITGVEGGFMNERLLREYRGPRLRTLDGAALDEALTSTTDIVFVATSDLGFHALIAGRRVHCYGVPFYAGWGLTQDMQQANQRTRPRSLEELAYVTLIESSKYRLPGGGDEVELEDALQWWSGQERRRPC